jgi:BirA family biotin operon repressor/biotin-[acetyl-CoA-carboxylase] ligase
LREQGFHIEAVRNRGYRVIEEPETLHADLLRYYAEARGLDLDILYYPVIDSTNSEAERQLSFGRATPFAVASSCQTKGRGRLGREWHSATADNLYLSVVFEPRIPPRALQHFTLWAGIFICRELQKRVAQAALNIKWPNDLLCGGRKFAGMLTEAKMDADHLRSIVFGIGLNLNSNPQQYPPALRQTATSLRAVEGQSLPLNEVAVAVVASVQAAYRKCLESDGSDDLREAWTPLNALQDQTVTVIVERREVSGICRGIDAAGALLLEEANGHIQAVRAGDVSIKKY